MMGLRKFDCGGAAAVIGAARAIGHMRPEGVEAHFIVAACSNMINSKALNIDAESRLTLGVYISFFFVTKVSSRII